MSGVTFVNNSTTIGNQNINIINTGNQVNTQNNTSYSSTYVDMPILPIM